MNNLINNIKSNFRKVLINVLGKKFYNKLSSKITYMYSLKKYYSKNNKGGENKPCVIYMADGKIIHGGLGDRLKGIISLYNYAKLKQIDFKIFFVSPFNLREYLIPNAYDWIIENEELSYNSNYAQAVIIKGDSNELQRILNRKNSRWGQLHVYTNASPININFHKDFFELFKVTSSLAEEINYHKTKIGMGGGMCL